MNRKIRTLKQSFEKGLNFNPNPKIMNLDMSIPKNGGKVISLTCYLATLLANSSVSSKETTGVIFAVWCVRRGPKPKKFEILR